MGIYRVRVRKNLSKKEIYLEKENNNKLELYLNDVYEKECTFKVDKEEVEFIRTAIEGLVTQIGVWIIDYFKELKLNENDDRYIRICEILKNKDDTECPCEIIGAGSFYEGTRNGFPDEFDFIFPLYYSESSHYCTGDKGNRRVSFPMTELNEVFSWVFNGIVHVIEKNKYFLQYESFDRKRKVYFDQYMDAKGPAAKLQFIYVCSSTENRNISVDFVPAIKVIGNKLEPTIDVACHNVGEFITEILITGEYLLVNSLVMGMSFATTETRFIRRVLSKNHKKMFKILKYLINGQEAGEKLENYLHATRSMDKNYSSYMIKTMIIRHHYTCTNTTTDNIGPCVLQVLNSMSEYEDVESFPFMGQPHGMLKETVTFYPSTQDVWRLVCGEEAMEYPLPLAPYLQTMSVYLQFLQDANGDEYDYEKDKLKKSASQMYLDDLNQMVIYHRITSMFLPSLLDE